MPHLVLIGGGSGSGKTTIVRDLKKKLKLMKKWANYCAENFLHKQLIMEAELARLGSDDSEARRLYKEAAASARDAGFPLNATISNELAGRFELERGREGEAETLLQVAREGYVKWGAKAKVKVMDEEFKTILTKG